MSTPPDNPRIFHITHVENLLSIAQTGVVWSDAKRLELGLDCHVIGMSEIKARRLSELTVSCHPGTKVGEYVPFNLCGRSVMLYILYRGNLPGVTFQGGQGPLVHLVADLRAVAAWADAVGRRWALSDRNAGSAYAEFLADLAELDRINWEAVNASDFRDAGVKESKQAEFLLYESFPWRLVEEIGVRDAPMMERVREALVSAEHQPLVSVRREWYY